MSWNNNRSGGGSNARTDRFGNAYQLKLAGQKVDKKSGDLVPNVYTAYFEIGGKLYSCEVSPANKDKKDGRPGVWVKLTRKEQKRQSNARF